MSSGDARKGRPADPVKREAVLDAATRAFFAQGYAATTIEGVAADAGVSKVTVYNRFGDKRSLFAAAVERECEKVRGQLTLDEGQGPLRERLQRFGRAMHAFVFSAQMTAFERRIAAETEADPEMGLAFLEAGPRRMKQGLAEMLDRANARGELACPDTNLGAELLAGMIKGMADLERRFTGTVDEARAERRIDEAVELFLCAYAAQTDFA